MYFDLTNKGHEFDDYDQIYPTDDQMLKSVYDLGLCKVDGYLKWYEFCDKNDIPRPVFTEEEFSSINPNQDQLPFVFAIDLESE